MNFNDACTLWFEQFGPWNWSRCCVAHDLDYWLQVEKALADARLAHCVNNILPGMGSIMWLGVTIFGGLFYARAAAKHFGSLAAPPADD